MSDDTVLLMIQECRRHITEPVGNLELLRQEWVDLTLAGAQALLDETRYELEPEPDPFQVAELREELHPGCIHPFHPVVMACIDMQRRCVKGRDVLEAIAGLPEDPVSCYVQTYRCERWSQVSSMYWSCILESLAP